MMEPMRLHRDADGYALIDSRGEFRSLRIDFTSRRLQRRIDDGGRELSVQATRAGPRVRILDCTAGLGTDSFILASRGAEVVMLERSNSLYLMLRDALIRAREHPRVSEIANRLDVVRCDARSCLAGLETPPDVVFIDPMFPSRRKAARVKGELQLLQRLLGKDEDARSLVVAARRTGCKRVVLKRPRGRGEIPGLVPSYVVKGKASRFDVFVQ